MASHGFEGMTKDEYKRMKIERRRNKKKKR